MALVGNAWLCREIAIVRGLKQMQMFLRIRKMLRLEKPNLEGMDVESTSCEKPDSMPATTNSMACLSLSNMIKVKAEPLDNNELHNSDRIVVATFSVNKALVKTELEIPNKLYEDKLDHMQLQDRIKMQTKGKNSESKISGNSECLRKAIPSDVKYGSSIPEAPDPIRFIRRWKSKKTVSYMSPLPPPKTVTYMSPPSSQRWTCVYDSPTIRFSVLHKPTILDQLIVEINCRDSVETALEEDAPGLLQLMHASFSSLLHEIQIRISLKMSIGRC